MQNNELTNSFKFKVDKDIIYCNVFNPFNEDFLDSDLEEMFSTTVSKLSRGKFMPIMINIRALDFGKANKVYHFLSNNSKIKSTVLSAIFLVDTYQLKIHLTLKNCLSNLFVPDAVFKNFNAAVNYCNEYNNMYNAVG